MRRAKHDAIRYARRAAENLEARLKVLLEQDLGNEVPELQRFVAQARQLRVEVLRELGKVDEQQEQALRARLGRELGSIFKALGVDVEGAHWGTLGAQVKRVCAGGRA